MTNDTMKVTVRAYGHVQHPITIQIDHTTKRIEFQIKGHPSGSKAVRIPDALAGRFKHLTLHRHDLDRARKFLSEFEKQGCVDAVNPISVVCQALWYGAIGSTMKCFQASKSREKLDADTIFGTDKSKAEREAFDYMKSMRNKHVLHDENDWHQAIPVAVVAPSGSQPQVGDVQCQVMEGDSAYSDIPRLRTVIDTTLAWVKTEFNSELAAIVADLESRSHADLIALDEVIGNTPYQGSVGKKRKS